jgi:hypothetical protein
MKSPEKIWRDVRRSFSGLLESLTLKFLGPEFGSGLEESNLILKETEPALKDPNSVLKDSKPTLKDPNSVLKVSNGAGNPGYVWPTEPDALGEPWGGRGQDNRGSASGRAGDKAG